MIREKDGLKIDESYMWGLRSELRVSLGCALVNGVISARSLMVLMTLSQRFIRPASVSDCKSFGDDEFVDRREELSDWSSVEY